MSLLIFKFSRNGLSPLLRSSLAQSRAITMKAVPAAFVPEKDAKQQAKRMKAPTLSIYKLDQTSVLSVVQRFSGVALTSYVTALGLGAILSPHDLAHYTEMATALSPEALVAAKFAIAFPVTFHSVNGLRYLLWAVGKCMTIKTIYTTGNASIAVSALLAGVCAAL